MRKTRSQTQAENGPTASTRSYARPAASGTKTSSSSTKEKDHDKTDNPFAASSNPPPSKHTNRQAIELDPAKLKEYQDMIQTFRVVDLHKVLQFLSLSVAGRKHELQQRVLDLLKTNFELVSTKLREIYRSDYYSDRNVQYGPPDPKRMFSHMQMPTVQSTADVRSAMVSVGNVGNPGVAPNPGNGGGAVAPNMGVPFQHTIGASMPIHPDVRLKKLAFYDVLATLIKPSSLLPRTNQRIQELPFYFTLTPQQATEIATNRDIRNGSKVEHSIQVQLRFCLLETSCEQEDCFPSNVIVKVNNKLCPLPNPIPTNRPNVEPKRPPRPVNVTSNVKLSPTVTNTITVQWCPDFSRGYCIAAYLVKKLTSSQLLHRMKTKGIKPADYTRGLIKEKLTEDADCEIATTMLKVSLNCPLGKMKMSIPCRASTCSHLQCFDANLYLQMNERKPTWNCPVCDKAAIYDHLVIDGYFQEVLASSLLGSEDTEIQLHKDGSWSTHNLRNETQLIDTPSKPVEKVELISDDIELITDDVKPVSKAPPPPVISNEPTSTTNSETVDLTLSDSDDDMPLAKRKTAASKTATTSSAVSTSNGQRSSVAQPSQPSKGVLEGSLIHEEQSLKPVCDISNKIRQYLKTCHIPSIIPITPPAPVEKGDDINHKKTTTPKSNLETTSSTIDAPSIPAKSNKTSTNELENCSADTSIDAHYYGRSNDTIDKNTTEDTNLSEFNSKKLQCLKAETVKPISGIILPEIYLNKPKKQKSNRRSKSSQSTKDQSVVPFDRILETTLGPDSDKSNISKQQKFKLRKMWAIENKLHGTPSARLSTSPTRKRNYKDQSDLVQGYCPPPSTRSRTMDTSSLTIDKPERALPANINSETLAISQFWDTPFLPIQMSNKSLPKSSTQRSHSLVSEDSHINSHSEASSFGNQTFNTSFTNSASRNNKKQNRKLCARFKRMHTILSDPDITSKYDPKAGRTRSLPPGVHVHELLDFAIADIDSIYELDNESKMQLKSKQPFARHLLQRCKYWQNAPQKLLEAFQKGLI